MAIINWVETKWRTCSFSEWYNNTQPVCKTTTFWATKYAQTTKNKPFWHQNGQQTRKNKTNPVSFHQELTTIPIGKDIKRFSTVTIVLSPICKPTQEGTFIPLQEALCYLCIT